MSKFGKVNVTPQQETGLNWAKFGLWLVHLSGAIGIAFAPDFFLPFTPFTLFAGAALLLWFHPTQSMQFYTAALVTAILAWGVEVVGVASGYVFGVYDYGSNLGIKVCDVPLLIGVLWAGLILSLCNVSYHVFKLKNRWSLSVAVASSMVFLDILMEFVAPPFDFWFFAHSVYAPLQNFVAWWLLAFVLSVLFYKPFVRARHPLALTYVAVQLVFFVLCVAIHKMV
jgi:uncharacterized membrane protein